MGGAASINDIPEILNEEQCRFIAGNCFDEALFRSLSDNGCVYKETFLLALSDRLDVYLSYDSAANSENSRLNIVSQVNNYLRQNRLKTCLLDDKDASIKQMSQGIDNSQCIIIFVTKQFMDKANSNDGNDRCHLEFNQMILRKTAARIISIVLEENMVDTMKWVGKFGIELGNRPFIDLVKNIADPSYFESKMKYLYGAILRIIGTPVVDFSMSANIPKLIPSSKLIAPIDAAQPIAALIKDGRTDVFLTHDWGKELGVDNHARVAIINAALRSRGLVTWFDQERMQGSTLKQMTKGIDNAKCVVVCLTKRYIDKVNGSDAGDNCQLEFNYAALRKTPAKMIPLILEERLSDLHNWAEGKVGEKLQQENKVLSSDITVEMWEDLNDPAYLDRKISELYRSIRQVIGNDDVTVMEDNAAQSKGANNSVASSRITEHKANGANNGSIVITQKNSKTRMMTTKESKGEEDASSNSNSNNNDIYILHSPYRLLDAVERMKLASVHASLEQLGYTVQLQPQSFHPGSSNSNNNYNMDSSVALAIDNARCVLIFLDKQFVDIVNDEAVSSSGRNISQATEEDQLRHLFDYALRRRTASRMVAIVLDPRMRNPCKWSGTMAASLGGKTYVDLCGEIGNPMEDINEAAAEMSVYFNYQMEELHILVKKALHVTDATAQPLFPIQTPSPKTVASMDAAKPLPIVVGKTNVFITHDWGRELNMDNHSRVCQVEAGLRNIGGLTTYFEREKVAGNTMKQIVYALDNTDCVLVFITRRYIEKVCSADAGDSCQLIFNYALLRPALVARLIPVVMETRMLDMRLWQGLVGAHLRDNSLVVDMTGDVSNLDYLQSKVREILVLVKRLTNIPAATLRVLDALPSSTMQQQQQQSSSIKSAINTAAWKANSHIYKFDAFLSCENGFLPQVRKISAALRSKGLIPWLKEEQLSVRAGEDVMQCLAEGIEESRCVVVFLSKNYIEKVTTTDATVNNSSKSPTTDLFNNRTNNNVEEDVTKLVFTHASRLKTSVRMVPVVMESKLRNPATWGTSFNAALLGDGGGGSNSRYIDMAGDLLGDDTEYFDGQVDELYASIVAIIKETDAMAATTAAAMAATSSKSTNYMSKVTPAPTSSDMKSTGSLTTMLLKDLTIEQVSMLLHALDFEMYVEALRKHNIDGECLQAVDTIPELQELGVTLTVKAKILFNKLKILQQQGVPMDLLRAGKLASEAAAEKLRKRTEEAAAKAAADAAMTTGQQMIHSPNWDNNSNYSRSHQHMQQQQHQHQLPYNHHHHYHDQYMHEGRGSPGRYYVGQQQPLYQQQSVYHNNNNNIEYVMEEEVSKSNNNNNMIADLSISGSQYSSSSSNNRSSHRHRAGGNSYSITTTTAGSNSSGGGELVDFTQPFRYVSHVMVNASTVHGVYQIVFHYFSLDGKESISSSGGMPSLSTAITTGTGGGRDSVPFQLAHDEYIKKIVYYQDNNCLHSLQFSTNKGRASMVYGNINHSHNSKYGSSSSSSSSNNISSVGRWFDAVAPNGFMIVGIVRGKSAHSLIEDIEFGDIGNRDFFHPSSSPSHK